MEYKCDICGAPATVHITKIVNGQKIKMHLCQACAQKNANLYSSGFPAEIFPQIKKLEEKILDMAFASGVKVRQDADLAEMLAAIDIDSEIPPEAFAAVAEILSYIYELNASAQQGLFNP